MYDPEAIYQDADLEMAELTETANLIAARNRAGVCTHEATVRRSRTGQIFYPEQVGLTGDQERCRNCGRTFRDQDDWIDARHEAIYG